jgi:hypothetical protein
MNELVKMAIQGGRYLEAENKLGQIIEDNPNDEAFFCLASVKSNLLLDKGRSFNEVAYCFNRYLELSSDRSVAEKNIMVFSIGLYSQLQELIDNLKRQRKSAVLNTALGVLVTFASSKIIDNSKNSFGVISGFVGASMGIGISLESISNIGDISQIIKYCLELNFKLIEYLKSNIKSETKLLENEILVLNEKYNVIKTDSNIDVSILKNLNQYFRCTFFIPPANAIPMTQDNTGQMWEVKSTFGANPLKDIGLMAKKRLDFADETVIGGLSSKPGTLDFIITDKVIYHSLNCKSMPLDKVEFKKDFLGMVGIKGSALMNIRSGNIKDKKKVVQGLNDFFKKLKP